MTTLQGDCPYSYIKYILEGISAFTDEAAKFFIWLLNYKFEGAINAAAFEPLSVKELCYEMGKYFNKPPNLLHLLVKILNMFLIHMSTRFHYPWIKQEMGASKPSLCMKA